MANFKRRRPLPGKRLNHNATRRQLRHLRARSEASRDSMRDYRRGYGEGIAR